MRLNEKIRKQVIQEVQIAVSPLYFIEAMLLAQLANQGVLDPDAFLDACRTNIETLTNDPDVSALAVAGIEIITNTLDAWREDDAKP